MSRRELQADDLPSVDFVVGDGLPADADEELPDPPRRSWRRRGALLAVLALIVGIVVVRIASTQPTPHPAAASSSPADGGSIPAGPAQDLPARYRPQPQLSYDPRSGVQNCPDILACTVSRFVPDGVRRALAARFPGVSVRSMISVLGLRDGGVSTVLLMRSFTARAGAVRLSVEIHTTASSDVARAGTRTDARDVTSYFLDLVPQYTVYVEATRARPAAAVPVATLAVLADDPRLLAQ